MAWSEQIAPAIAHAADAAFGEAGLQVAVAAVENGGTTISSGRCAIAPGGRFEIGSVTKTMTGTLLALLAADGTLRLEDEAGRWLAAGDNGHITLLELATHTSGLPRHGPDRTPEAAEAELRNLTLTPGRYAYSNFGFQLLGLVLERASGTSFAQLLASRLLEPLAMTCSGAGLAGPGQLIPGHAWGLAVPAMDQPLPASGAVQATIADLAGFARACLKPPPGALGEAIAAAQLPRVAVDQANAQGLGWHIRDGRVRWHDGGTGGFSATVMLDPDPGRAIAIAVNTCGNGGLLTRAALLSLAGRDPGRAFPQAPADYADRVREVTAALLEGRAADAHAALSGSLRARITTAQLERWWWMSTLDARGPATVAVACQPGDEGLVAIAAVRFASAGRGVTARFRFDAGAQITDLQIKRSR